MPVNSDDLLSLELQTHLRVAGEKVEGTVLLNFKELQHTPLEEVTVDFGGTVLTGLLSDTTADR